MNRSHRLAMKYFTAAIVFFGVMVIAGLLSAAYYLHDGLLLNRLDFSTAKILHIDTMILWLLMGFIGAIYWFLPLELEHDTVGVRLGEVMFWILCAAIAVVALVFLFVQ